MSLAGLTPPPPTLPPLASPPSVAVESFVIGSILSILAGFFTALSMIVNRWALCAAATMLVSPQCSCLDFNTLVIAHAFISPWWLKSRLRSAHAKPQRLRCVPFIVKPWMVWVLAMVLYNLGATVLASIAQIFIPLSFFACLFITLLVVNLFLARWVLKEQITPPKVWGAALIVLGAILAGAGTPTDVGGLQDEYPCKAGQKCVHERVGQLASAPESIALLATLGAVVLLSLAAIVAFEVTYPTADLHRVRPATPGKSPSGTRAERGAPSPAARAEADMRAAGASPRSPVMEHVLARSPARRASTQTRFAPAETAEAHAPRSPRLAPRWLERTMAFVYPASMGADEAIAHLWLRADTAMLTQCDVGGCANGVFGAAVATRWTASIATSFWLVVVFRRYETTVALPIEYGTTTALDVLSGLVFYRECVRPLRRTPHLCPWILPCLAPPVRPFFFSFSACRSPQQPSLSCLRCPNQV